ncbi:tetratricopeptide repeat protein [Azospirillum griseum]|uniref:Tetratricopeptide repeat protein n=1 Tax=Azospirillum griseum TaxID=2496639 RepID=A0A431VM04_9PROT|nr:tetratricopeptide repeat protein [Azospirillum griseum]RTR22486.1 tetratricopeptide repeat protein [Azospirillum griseum]
MNTNFLTQALTHHQAGRFGEAEDGYRTVLATDPKQPDALHLLGVLCLQTARTEEATDLIERAITENRDVADYWDNYGSALAMMKRPADAARAHHNAVLLNPMGPQFRHNLGNAAAALGRHDVAQRSFATAVALRPDYAKAWYNLGNTERALGRLEASITALSNAVHLTPGMVEAHNNLGDALALTGRLREAVHQHRIVVAQRPNDATAHYNLGAALQQMGANEGAEIAYREALKRQPRHAPALNNLGTVLRRLGRADQAEICHRQALELHPDFVEARYNLGNALQALGRFKEAEACFEDALAQEPDLATAAYNLSLLALRHGDLARGWSGYGRRFAAGEVRPNRSIAAPLWTGQGLQGQRLLVWREQGIGDEILFASCYPDLLAWSGGKVTIECDPRLVTLFQRSFPQATVRAESCTPDARETIVPPDCDLQVPAGNLPVFLRRDLSSFDSPSPWLKPDPQRVDHWRARVDALGPGLKVGIGWRSQLMTAERRSAYTRLDQWGPLFAVPGLVFVNLQYDECAEEIRDAEQRFGVRIHQWSDLDLKDDFESAAALTANLDLVISPAMSAGELAGALGVPVWRFGGRDWTQLGTAVRPWFPSMTLFQPKAGEGLDHVLSDMARTLRRMVDPAPNPPFNPVSIDGLLNSAIGWHRQGHGDEAQSAYRRILALDPSHADALHLLGLIAHQTNEVAQARRLIGTALRVSAHFPTAWNHLGLVFEAEANRHAATRAFQTALALSPNFPEALTHLGLARQNAQRFDEAHRLHARSIRLLPDNHAAHTNIGHLCELKGRFAEANAHYRRSAALRPNSPDSQNNLATMAMLAGTPAQTRQFLERALRLAPGFPLASWNHGLLALADGDLSTGWAGYKQRFSARQLQRARRIPRPQWTGEALGGRRLLVWSEQGVGDEILFSSCFNRLEGLDGPVTIECDRRLVPLFTRSFPWATVREESIDSTGQERIDPPDCDLQAPAGDLPALCRAGLADFPDRMACLVADPALIERWRDRVAALGDGLKIGLGWRSQVMTAQRQGAYTALADWSALFDVPGVQVINLQYGDCAAEVDALERQGRRLHQWADLNLKDDFDGVAALMRNLDLVISPAMAVGELAGALGVPVWRVGNRDWTWLGTAVRPWFPSMRLFAARSGETLADVANTTVRHLAKLGAAQGRI